MSLCWLCVTTNILTFKKVHHYGSVNYHFSGLLHCYVASRSRNKKISYEKVFIHFNWINPFYRFDISWDYGFHQLDCCEHYTRIVGYDNSDCFSRLREAFASLIFLQFPQKIVLRTIKTVAKCIGAVII